MAAEEAAAEVVEEAAETATDPAETIGVLWAKFTDPEFLSQLVADLVTVLFVLILTAIVYMLVMMVFKRAIVRMDRDASEAVQPQRRRSQRVVTVLALVRSIAKWVIFIGGGVWALASVGIDVTTLIAGAGILGLAIGFGAQNLVRDLVSGFFLLLEGQYAVGDYVQVGPLFGMVESIGMRVTVLLDLDNQRHYLPNGGITTVTVYEEPFVNHIIETPIADGANPEKLAGMIDQLVDELQEQYPHYLVYHGQAFVVASDDGPLVRISAAGFPTQDWIVTEELPMSIRELLRREGIALQEGRDVRTYMDLSRMPIYNIDTEEVGIGGGE